MKRLAVQKINIGEHGKIHSSVAAAAGLGFGDTQLLGEILDRLRQLQHFRLAQLVNLQMRKLDLELGLVRRIKG